MSYSVRWCVKCRVKRWFLKALDGSGLYCNKCLSQYDGRAEIIHHVFGWEPTDEEGDAAEAVKRLS